MTSFEESDAGKIFQLLKRSEGIWGTIPEASTVNPDALEQMSTNELKVLCDEIDSKIGFLEVFSRWNINTEALKAFANLTSDKLSNLACTVNIVEKPVSTEVGPAVHVRGSVSKPEGFKESLVWIDADLDTDFLVYLQEERVKFAALHGLDPYDEKYFPDAHLTIKFGIDPSACDSIEKVRRAIASCGEFKFVDMVPLGPKGKENAWGLHTNDPTIFKLMSDAASDSLLSREHADYVSTNGWAKLPPSGFAILPHITFVRNLPSLDLSKPPAFEGLDTVVCKLSHLRLRTGVIGEKSGIKIKLIKDFPPYDGTY